MTEYIIIYRIWMEIFVKHGFIFAEYLHWLFVHQAMTIFIQHMQNTNTHFFRNQLERLIIASNDDKWHAVFSLASNLSWLLNCA